MAIDLGANIPFGPQALNTASSTASSVNSTLELLNSLFGNNSGGTIAPQQNQSSGLDKLIGLLLTGGSMFAGRDEPGFITESRQALRNIQQPEGFGNVFANTVSGLEGQFSPRLQQLEDIQANRLQQRVKSAFPSTAPLQGAEIGSLLAQARDEFLPQRQAFLGQLGLSGIEQQQQAARTILGQNEENLLRKGLADLAAAFLTGQMGGGIGGGLGRTGTGTGTGGGGGLLDTILNIGKGIFGGNIAQQIGSNLGPILPAVTGGVGSLLSSFFGPTSALTTSPLAATQIAQSPALLELASALGVPPEALAAQMAGQGTGAAGATAGQGFFSPLGSLGGALQGAGIGAAGFGAGNLIGGQLPGTQIGATLAGAGGGALAGGAVLAGLTALGATGIGLPLALVLGALGGGAGGFFGSRSASQMQKAANLKADQDSQAGQIRAVSDFFLPQIEALGGDVSPLMDQVANLINTVDDPGDQQSQLASLLGGSLLAQANAVNPNVRNLGDIPGLRSNFLSYMSQNAFVSPKAGSQSPLGTSGEGAAQFATIAEAAGFRPGLFSERGGTIASLAEAFTPIMIGLRQSTGNPIEGILQFVDSKINLSADVDESGLVNDTVDKLAGELINDFKAAGQNIQSISDIPDFESRLRSTLQAGGVDSGTINSILSRALAVRTNNRIS